MMIMGSTHFLLKLLSHLVTLGIISTVLVACGGSNNTETPVGQGVTLSSQDEDDEPAADEDPLSDISTYKFDSPYRSEIPTCVRAESLRESCYLSDLPTLGMEYNDPGIPQIMERVAVSHDWMGMRFEELLHELPTEMLPLFRGVTAIVIDADIRPAYYTPYTGAIYIDPAYLWTTLSEKATINKQQDFRAGFDDPLGFRSLWRYVKDDNVVSYVGSLYDDSVRELDDIILSAAQLFLHELAHANDFVPSDAHDTLNLNADQRFLDAVFDLENQWVSSVLSETQPLFSDELFSLAGVMFKGNDPNTSDLDFTASEVGEAFAPDGAGDIYGYTSQYEDLAMLFETTMMKHFFGAEFEMAFTSTPMGSASSCASYIIGWGVRNRVGDESVRDRAEFAASQVLPSVDLGDFFENLEPPTPMTGDWCFSPSSASKTGAHMHKHSKHPVDIYDFIRPYH